MHCQTCGRVISSEYQFCPHCGYAVDRFSLPKEMVKKEEKSPFNKTGTPGSGTTTKDDDSTEKFIALIAVILLIFHFPIGLLFMWITKSFSRSTRWVITLVLLLVSLFGFIVVIWWTSSPGYLM